MFYSNDTNNKDFFDKNFRNQKQPSTEGMPDPNSFANSINKGNGAFNKEVPKRRRTTKKQN